MVSSPTAAAAPPLPAVIELSDASSAFPSLDAEWQYLNSLYEVWEHLTPAHRQYYDTRLPIVQQKRREQSTVPSPSSASTTVSAVVPNGDASAPASANSSSSSSNEGGSLSLQERLAKKKAELLASKAPVCNCPTSSSRDSTHNGNSGSDDCLLERHHKERPPC